MDREFSGVSRKSATSIQIDFYFNGIRCREFLKLAPTSANMRYAARFRASVLHDIAINKFNYAERFPNSPHAEKLGKLSNKTISEALDEFMLSSKQTLEASTLRGYSSAIEYHLRPAFGSIKLRELTTRDIKDWITGLSISAKRINNVLIPLRHVLKDAYIDELIDTNPADRIKNLSHRYDEPHPFSPQEVKDILEHCPTQDRNLFQFAFTTGLRTSELIALEWSDIDFEKGVIKVRRASVRGVIKAPKTKAGNRDVRILPPALAALNSQLELTGMNHKRVFLNFRTNAAWETDGQIRKVAWILALKAAGVEYRNPYQTRHTYASTLLSLGENPMWVAYQMGHADWGMIRKRYGRWIPDANSSAGDKAMNAWALNGHSAFATN